MAELEVDFAGVGDGDFKPIPAGEYEMELARVNTSQVKKPGKNKGKSIYRLMFKVTENNDEHVGRTVWTNYVHTDESRWVLKAMLRAWGVEPPESGPVRVNFDDYMGVELRARVKVTPASKNEETGDEYEAKNDIAKFVPHPSLVDA